MRTFTLALATVVAAVLSTSGAAPNRVHRRRLLPKRPARRRARMSSSGSSTSA